MITRYSRKLEEICKARNTSAVASKVRGFKWTHAQLVKVKEIAALKENPTIDSIKRFYPTLSKVKSEAILVKIKQCRKGLATAIEDDKVKGIRNSNGVGTIYLVENELYEGWIKCGMTTNITTRINSYNCNDPLKRFRVITEKLVADRRKSENLLKYNLKMQSEISNGEWFRIDKEKALLVFNEM